MKIILVGASNNKEKYGNKILNFLITKGYTIFPVNNKEEVIEGLFCYNNIGEIKEEFDIINFVIKPEFTLEILKKYKDSLISKIIWCQPGASNNNVNSFLKKNNFKKYIIDKCIMKEDIKKMIN